MAHAIHGGGSSPISSSILNTNKLSLLSSQARVQVPWIRVTIGNYVFGVFDEETRKMQNSSEIATTYNTKYPNYIQSLSIKKVNGKVNTYTLSINYPIRPQDDPNFFEKVFSSVSSSRKIIFSYGDAMQPNYVYKDEEAIITDVQESISLQTSSISYVVTAVSSSIVAFTGSFTFARSAGELVVPSREIIRIFKDQKYGLQNLFTGMSASNIVHLVEGGDKAVELETKTNISPLDYINYLVSCMIPDSDTTSNKSSCIYILTIHDDTIYDQKFNDELTHGGPYFKVSSTSLHQEHTDAYILDVGFNTSTIVRNLTIQQNKNFSIFYDYSTELNSADYVRRLSLDGEWEEIYAPAATSKNSLHKTRAEDISWLTKVTQYPIVVTVEIQGLLRPAHLMQYVRLNVLFPGGGVHVSSGLYIITSQLDNLSGNGYTTTLTLNRIGGID